VTAAAIAWGLLGLSGCRGLNALRQRCIAGEVSACESACSKGVAGEGGCRHAGNLYREKANFEFGSTDALSAAGFFDKGCKGGDGDSCLFAAQMIEGPYDLDPTGAPDAAPKTIEDAELARREKLLTLSCREGSTQGCKRLGDVLIGKDTGRATRAYVAACQSSTAAAACAAARRRETHLAEHYRSGCTRSVADDCTSLGDFLRTVDLPRAMRLFVAECELRGVADVAGGVGGFVRARASSVRGVPLLQDGGAPANVAPPTPSGAAVHVVVGPPSVKGQLALVEVTRAFGDHAADFQACAARATPLPEDVPSAQNAKPAGQVKDATVFHLVVDLTGDVWKATPDDSKFGADALSCFETTFERLRFTELSSIALLTVPVTIERAPGNPTQKP
jgi:hypothetical protein